jgi:hypothetical protein
MGRGAVSVLTSGSDGGHTVRCAGGQEGWPGTLVRPRKGILSKPGDRSSLTVTAPAELRIGLDQKKLLLLVMMHRMAGEAVQVRSRMTLPEIDFMAASTALQNRAGLSTCVGRDLVRITSGSDMLSAGPVAAFATTGRGVLALQSLGVR